VLAGYSSADDFDDDAETAFQNAMADTNSFIESPEDVIITDVVELNTRRRSRQLLTIELDVKYEYNVRSETILNAEDLFTAVQQEAEATLEDDEFSVALATEAQELGAAVVPSVDKPRTLAELEGASYDVVTVVTRMPTPNPTKAPFPAPTSSPVSDTTASPTVSPKKGGGNSDDSSWIAWGIPLIVVGVLGLGGAAYKLSGYDTNIFTGECTPLRGTGGGGTELGTFSFSSAPNPLAARERPILQTTSVHIVDDHEADGDGYAYA